MRERALGLQLDFLDMEAKQLRSLEHSHLRRWLPAGVTCRRVAGTTGLPVPATYSSPPVLAAMHRVCHLDTSLMLNGERKLDGDRPADRSCSLIPEVARSTTSLSQDFEEWHSRVQAAGSAGSISSCEWSTDLKCHLHSTPLTQLQAITLCFQPLQPHRACCKYSYRGAALSQLP